jgi:APA family basic amino acid/polyamine antiporter
MLVYILYYLGLAGAVPNAVLMESGQEGAKIAYSTVFSSLGGSLLFVFVIISCLGTLNGLMLGCTRGIYALAARGEGIKPKIFSQLDPVTNMPSNSSIFALLLCSMWFVFFYGANLTANSWFGFFSFDSSELPIITIYAFYIPIFLMFMKKEKDLGVVKRFVMPILSVGGSVFMIIAACFAHQIHVVAYLIVSAVIMIIAGLNYKK